MNSLENKIYVLNDKFELSLKDEKLDVFTLNDDEFVCETLYSCISPGTELAAYKGLPPLRPGKQYPRLMGYCNVSRVIKIMNGLSKFAEGDLVLTFSSHRKYFKCSTSDIIAILPHECDLKKVSTVYLYHLGFMAILESEIKPGMKVGIVGMGTLGYCTALLCKQFGFTVSVFSNQQYLQNELEMQFICFYKKDKESIQEVKNKLDVIINTSNYWEDWFISMELLRKKGMMVNLGFPGRGEKIPELNPLDSRYFYDKQLTLKTAGYVYEGDPEPWDIQHTLKRNIAYLLNLISENRLDPDKIISREVKWFELKDLYEFLMVRGEKKFTGILNWNIDND